MDAIIPSREDHRRLLRRIWIGCLAAAAVCFIGMVTLVFGMARAGHDSKTIVNVMLIAVYIVVPIYGIGYIGPAFATSLLKMDMAVEMSREGLEIGRETAEVMRALKEDVVPIIADAKTVLASVSELVRQLNEQNPKAIVDFLERLAKDGTVEKIASSVETVAKKVHEVLDRQRPSAEGNREDLISGIGGPDARSAIDLR